MASRLVLGLRSRWANGKQLARISPRFGWRLATLRLRRDDAPADPSAVHRFTGIFRRDDVDRLAATLDRMRGFDPYLLWTTEFQPGHSRFQKAWELGMVATYLPDLSGKHTLDIGSGNSTFPVYLAGCCGASAVSFDLPAPNALRLWWSKRQYARYHVRRDEGDMLSLPYDDDSWDLVTCISVIEHLNWQSVDGDWQTVTSEHFLARTTQALSEMCRVCRPGGHVYVTSDVLTKPPKEGPQDPRATTGYSLGEIHDHWIPTFERLGMELVRPEPFDEATLHESMETGREVPYRHKRPFAFLLQKRPR